MSPECAGQAGERANPLEAEGAAAVAAVAEHVAAVAAVAEGVAASPERAKR